jgi:hypothetical protein
MTLFTQEVDELAKRIGEASTTSTLKDWYVSNKGICPNCGLDFSCVGAEYNLYPHFIGQCKRT